jgi:hypothetical protein
MPRKPKPKPDDPAQMKRFIEGAREVEAGETAEDFERAFKKVVLKKPITKSRKRAAVDGA